jgi:hypothetical protein
MDRTEMGVAGALLRTLRAPVLSLTDGAATKNGLSLHIHDRAWLAVVAGAKEWVVVPPQPQGAEREIVADAWTRRQSVEPPFAYTAAPIEDLLSIPGVRHSRNRSR